MPDKLRIQAIDFTKGSLVICMAIYHAMGYFVSGHPVLYRYVEYVSESFIFYSGYLCGVVYMPKYSIETRGVVMRLLERGFKLLLLFVFLNVLVAAIGGGLSTFKLNGHGILYYLYDIFIAGNDRAMAFEILLPISYTLLLAPLLMFSFQLRYIHCAVFVLALIALSCFNYKLPYNFKAIILGLGGVIVGLISYEISKKVIVYLVYLFSVIYLCVYFLYLAPQGIHVRLIGYALTVCAALVLFYMIEALGFLPSIVSKYVAVMGRYSLLMYLYQIFFLRLLLGVWDVKYSYPGYGYFSVVAILVASSVLFCVIVDRLRAYNNNMDRLYRVVFS